MKRKERSDSADAAIKAATNAAMPLPEIPGHVRIRDSDKPFWVDILRARLRTEWTEADLIVAAQLARTMSDIETESVKLDSEGSVVENQRGTPVMNPRHAVLEQLARREMALMRSLQITGTAKGDKRDLQKARTMQAQAERLAKELEEDDLLA